MWKISKLRKIYFYFFILILLLVKAMDKQYKYVSKRIKIAISGNFYQGKLQGVTSEPK